MTDLDQLTKPVRQIRAERDDARLWAAHLGAQQLDGASEPDPPDPVQDPQPCDHDDQPAPTVTIPLDLAEDAAVKLASSGYPATGLRIEDAIGASR